MQIQTKIKVNRSRVNGESGSDICWKLLSLSFFFSPLRCYGLFTIGSFTGSLYKILSLAMMFALLMKCLNKQTGYKIYADFPLKVIFLIICYDLFALIYSNKSNLGNFPSYFISHIIILFSYVVIQNTRGDLFSLVKSYVYGAVIPGLLGMYQWISVMTGKGVAQLPFKRFLVAAGKDDLFLYGNYRVVGTLLDPSYFGLYMSSIFLFCIGTLFFSNSIDDLKRKDRLIIPIIAILAVLCIFASGSITSMVAVFTGLLFLVLINRKHIGRIIKYAVVTFFIILIGLFFMETVFQYNPVQVLLDKLSIQSTSTSYGALYGRGVYYKVAFEEFLSSPLFGVGFGNLSLTSAHNTYLTILAMLGIIGFSLHAILIFNPYFQMNRKSMITAFSSISKAALFGMSIQLIGYDCLYKMDPTIVIMLLALAGKFEKRNDIC